MRVFFIFLAVYLAEKIVYAIGMAIDITFGISPSQIGWMIYCIHVLIWLGIGAIIGIVFHRKNYLRLKGWTDPIRRKKRAATIYGSLITGGFIANLLLGVDMAKNCWAVFFLHHLLWVVLGYFVGKAILAQLVKKLENKKGKEGVSK